MKTQDKISVQDENGNVPKPMLVAVKGDYLGNCNVTRCQKPNSATWYNHSTQKYYCTSCAIKINHYNKREAMDMYGHDLCTLGNCH